MESGRKIAFSWSCWYIKTIKLERALKDKIAYDQKILWTGAKTGRLVLKAERLTSLLKEEG